MICIYRSVQAFNNSACYYLRSQASATTARVHRSIQANAIYTFQCCTARTRTTTLISHRITAFMGDAYVFIRKRVKFRSLVAENSCPGRYASVEKSFRPHQQRREGATRIQWLALNGRWKGKQRRRRRMSENHFTGSTPARLRMYVVYSWPQVLLFNHTMTTCFLVIVVATAAAV